MKIRTRLLSFLMAFIIVLGGLYLPAISASPEEATLTITPENGTPTSSNGTYNEMHAKLATELNKNPTVKTEFVLKLNSSASYSTWKQLNGNTNCYVTVDLNGFTLDVTNLKNNIYTLAAPITFTVDGADEDGNRGLIINDGKCGAIVFAKGGIDPAINVTVQNLEMYYTKMDQAYEFSTDKYPDQPMCNVGAGDLTVRNVKMTFTGENAVSGDPINKPISKMTTRMIQFSGGGFLTVDSCEFYDTNTKGIQVRVFDITSSSALIENSTVNAYMPFWNNKGSIQVYNCDITSKFATTQGNGTYIFNTTITADNGNIGDPSASHHQLHFMPSPEGDNIIYTSADMLNGCVLPDGWQFVKTAEGKFVMQPDDSLEATLVTSVYKGKASYATGSADSLLNNLKNISGVTTDTVYTLTLYKNASLSTAKTITGNPYTSVIIDLNGFDLDVSKIANNIFTIYGAASSSTVGGINFTIDGADQTNTRRSKVTSTAIAGGLVYPRNETRNTDTVVMVKNLEMYYTNLSQGFCDTTSMYPNQPMFNLPKGDVTLQNVKMTYTGEDAIAVEGSKGSPSGYISDMSTPFINFGGKTLTIDGCEFTDINTKDIRTRILAVSGNAKVYVNNSSLTAYLPIIANEGTTVFISNSTLTAKSRALDGTSFVFDSQADMYVTDSVMVAPDRLATSGTTDLHFVYGEGLNRIESTGLENIGFKSDFSQVGYYFSTYADGIYMMFEDTEVGATLAVYADGKLPEFFTGSFNEMYAKLNVKPAVKTKYVLILNQDVVYTFASVDTNSNATIFIDFNGHTFSAPGSNNIFQITGNYHLTIDGKDRDGNISEVICTGTAGSLVYPRANNGLNENSVIVISNLKMTYTNLSQAFSNSSPYNNQQIFHIPAGHITFNNVDMTYTGEDATTTDEVNKPLTKMVTDLVRIYGNATAVFNNCSIRDVNTKYIPAKCLVVNGNAEVVVNDCDISGGYTVSSATSGSVKINNSRITSSVVAYSGSNIVVTDSVTDVRAGALSDNTPTKFMYGSGKNEIITADGSKPAGSISVEEGYYLVRQSEKKYIISDGEGYSTVELPAIFQNGMVFQRNEPINVFGTCSTNNAVISVKLGDIIKQAIVSDGSWMVSFDPLEATYGLTLTVTQSDVNEYSEPISITDIAVGEVWVVSGQSNAEFETYKMEDYQEYLENADNFNNIRAFIADHNTSTQKSSGSGVWVKVNSNTLDKNNSLTKGDIPAIAYVMATKLATEFGREVPVAIINASYNGTSIRSWISPEFYPEESERYSPEELDVYNSYKSFYEANGRYPSSSAESEYYTGNFKNLTCGNYFGMLSFMEGYSIKGVLWYQGCGDSDFGDRYYTYLEALKKTMRSTFGNDELPILVVQLHASYWAGCDILASQSKSASDDKNCYLVSTFNEGTPFKQADYDPDANYNAHVFTHPSRKSPVGQRAADIALKNIYGLEEYENSGEPMVQKVTVSGDTLVLTFNQELCTEYDVAPTGFEIAGSDGVFYKANAVLSGNVITLNADEVPEPVTVRYAFGDAQILLEDGTIVPFNESISDNSTFTFTGTTIVAPDGTYIFTPDNPIVIKTGFGGNLYGISGHAVAIFKLDAGFVAA